MHKRISELEEWISKAKTNIKRWEKELHEIKTGTVDLEKLTRDYWNPDLTTMKICEDSSVSTFHLAKMIKPLQTGFYCSICGKEHTVKNRSEFKSFFGFAFGKHKKPWKDPQKICKGCKDEAERRQRRAVLDGYNQRAKKIQDLKTMPYSEYLQTDHWKEKRRYHLKRIKYRCQLCNAKDTTLHVHHRYYGNRGNEDFEDLLALCAECHKLFHEKRAVQ